MAIEDTLFIDDFPLETPISSGFPIATFDDTGGYVTYVAMVNDGDYG